MSAAVESENQVALAPAAYRAVRLLEHIGGAGRPLRLGEISVDMGWPKSSVHNLITTLESVGMLRGTPQGWVIGYRALEIGRAALGGVPGTLRRLVRAHPALATHTVLLAVLDGTDIVCVGRHDGERPVRLAVEVGDRMPAVVTGLGKAMVAAMGDEQRAVFLAGLSEMPQLTHQTHSLSSLRTELLAIRERGVAVDVEENTVGVTCFAAAIPAAQPMAIAVALPTSVVDDYVQRVLPAAVRRLAADPRLVALP